MEISSPGYSSLPVVNGDAQSNRSDQIITVEQKDRCHPEISVDPVAPDLQTRSESPWPHHEGFGPFIPAEKERILGCRRVTDGWMTVVFGFVSLWMLYTGCQVFGVGDSRRLSHGYDYRGRLCGVDVLYEPYVYWPPNPISNNIDLVSPICLRQCPTQSDVDKGAMISYPNRTVTTETLPDGREVTHVTVRLVDVPAYASRKFGREYCFPVDLQKSELLAKALGLTDEWMVITRVFKSIQVGWIFLLISGLIAVIFSFGYLLIIADIAWIICWITSSMAPLCLFFGSLYLGVAAVGSSALPSLVAALDWMPVRGLLLGSSITGVAISIFLLLSDSHLKQHSRKAVALAHATSECLWSAPNVLLYPIIGTSLGVIVWVFGIFVFIGLLTSPAAAPRPHLVPIEIESPQTINSIVFDHHDLAQYNSIRDDPIQPVPIQSVPIRNDDVPISNEIDDSPIAIDEQRSPVPQQMNNLAESGLNALDDAHSVVNSDEVDSMAHFLSTGEYSALEERRGRKLEEKAEPLDPGSGAGNTFGILRQFRWDLGLHWTCLLWAFSILWLLEIIHNLTQFAIAFTSAMWYFTVPDISGKRKDIGISASGCVWVAIRYHLGTIELSALILSTFRWLQFGAWAVRQRIKSSWADQQQRRRFSLLISVVQGILKSFEDTARFLNSGGLIECVLHSDNLIPSCRRAYDLSYSQIPSVLILGRISSILSMLNSIGLASTMSGLVLYISNQFSVFHDPTSDWFVDSPAGLAAATFGIVAVIARVVVFSFDQLSSTLLYCFLIESQSRSGVFVFAPEELRILVEEQESERRLERLQQAIPDHSILSLSMVAATRGPETLDELLLHNKSDEEWKETIQQFRDDTGLYEERPSVRTLHTNYYSAQNSQKSRKSDNVDKSLEMDDVRW